jgi:hypothetical protein
MTDVKTIKIDDVEYVRKDDLPVPAKAKNGDASSDGTKMTQN